MLMRSAADGQETILERSLVQKGFLKAWGQGPGPERAAALGFSGATIYLLRGLEEVKMGRFQKDFIC